MPSSFPCPEGPSLLKSSEGKPPSIFKGLSLRLALLGPCGVIPGLPLQLRVPPPKPQELAGTSASSLHHLHCRGGQSTLPWWCTGKQSVLQTGCCQTEWSHCWALPSRADIWSHWGRCGRVPLSHMELETHPECHLLKERGERSEGAGKTSSEKQGPIQIQSIEKQTKNAEFIGLKPPFPRIYLCWSIYRFRVH